MVWFFWVGFGILFVFCCLDGFSHTCGFGLLGGFRRLGGLVFGVALVI